MRAASRAAPGTVVRSLVPARMDRLPWSVFHTRLVLALGVTWVLDGLEITIASLVGRVLQSAQTLGLTSAAVGRAASVYLVGEVAGALVFGYLSDRLGRRRLFIATLGLYLVANGLTALAFEGIAPIKAPLSPKLTESRLTDNCRSSARPCPSGVRLPALRSHLRLLQTHNSLGGGTSPIAVQLTYDLLPGG